MAKGRRSALPHGLYRRAQEFTRNLVKDFGEAFETSADLKKTLSEIIQAQLPPYSRRPGRPQHKAVTDATDKLSEFRNQYPDDSDEQRWARVYPLVIPGFDQMKPREQARARRRLRAAVKGRASRIRRANRGVTNPSPDLSPQE